MDVWLGAPNIVVSVVAVSTICPPEALCCAFSEVGATL